MRGLRLGRLAAAAAVAALAAACGQNESDVRRTLDEYIRAVQAADGARLSRFSAEFQEASHTLHGAELHAALEGFIHRTEERLAAYEQAKKTGSLDLGADGVSLIKGLGLGRGVFYLVRDVAPEEGSRDRVRARMEVNLAYDFVPFEDYPEGTIIYLMGMPCGRLLAPVRGKGKGDKLEVLAQVILDCRLERALDPEHPTGWVVRSLGVVPGSARPGSVSWR
jgi:hypothetical protein